MCLQWSILKLQKWSGGGNKPLEEANGSQSWRQPDKVESFTVLVESILNVTWNKLKWVVTVLLIPKWERKCDQQAKNLQKYCYQGHWACHQHKNTECIVATKRTTSELRIFYPCFWRQNRMRNYRGTKVRSYMCFDDSCPQWVGIIGHELSAFSLAWNKSVKE